MGLVSSNGRSLVVTVGNSLPSGKLLHNYGKKQWHTHLFNGKISYVYGHGLKFANCEFTRAILQMARMTWRSWDHTSALPLFFFLLVSSQRPFRTLEVALGLWYMRRSIREGAVEIIEIGDVLSALAEPQFWGDLDSTHPTDHWVYPLVMTDITMERSTIYSWFAH